MDNELEIDFCYNIKSEWVKSVKIVKSVSDWKNITEHTESWRREHSRLTSTYTQLFRISRGFKPGHRPRWKPCIKNITRICYLIR